MTIERNFVGWMLTFVVVMGCARPGAVPSGTQHPVTPGAAEPAFSDVPDAADAPGGAQAHALQSAVTKVTVYSDRARVTRMATAEVSKDPTVFSFRGLPGWVDDGSVRVAVSAGRIVDVRVERSFLARATDKTWQKAEAKHKDLTNQLAVLTDEIGVLDAQKNQIENIKAFSREKITQDTIIGTISVKSYADVLAFVSDSLRATAKARRMVQQKRDRITPEYEASMRRLADLKNLMKLEETTVLVTLQGTRAAPSTVELTYMIPGATWEPKHELRVSTSDAKTVEVISFAVVTQTSGEDWGTAKLSFSTQSSTQSVRIPELEALTLGDTHTATRILTSKVSSFTRAQQAFEAQNQLWNEANYRSSARRERASFGQMYQRNMEYLQVVQSKTVQIFESLSKRGTTAHFQAIAAPNVRGDGHPVRMRIGRSTLASKQKLVAVPEQSLNAVRTLQMTNLTGQPFLPGKVALYQDGAFLGMTDIDFIAQGEEFSLFLSVADHIKLSRKLDRKQTTQIRKDRNRMQVSFIVTVNNLSSEETTLALADRIPVSENKDIIIDRIRITDARKPDSRGILHWNLTLKAKEKRQFRISYQVEYPSVLVLDARRERERRAATKSRAPSPSAPVPDGRYGIEEQLIDLEEQADR